MPYAPAMPSVLLSAFAVLAVLNLIASGTGNETLEWATKPLLMPVLAAWVWRVRPDAKGVIAALLLSAAGDIALLNGGDTIWFIAGMVLFLGAHACYIATFLRHGARPKPVAAAGYAVVGVAGLVWL